MAGADVFWITKNLTVIVLPFLGAQRYFTVKSRIFLNQLSSYTFRKSAIAMALSQLSADTA